MYFSLLLVLSAGVVASLSFGWAAARCRDHYERLKNPALVLLLSQTLALMLAGVLLGVWQLVSTSQSGRYWAVVIVGVLFAKDNLRNLRRINGAPPPSGTWALWHIHEMLGNGIAFYTAFAVFGFRRYVSLDLHGWWSILPWILPGCRGTADQSHETSMVQADGARAGELKSCSADEFRQFGLFARFVVKNAVGA